MRLILNRYYMLVVLSLSVYSLQWDTQLLAAFIDPNLPGTTAYDGWADLNGTEYPAYASFAITSWPTPIDANQPSSNGGGKFNRVSGGGYAASSSIYSIGPGSNFGIFQVTTGPSGVFNLSTNTPVPGLETVVFQIAIGTGTQTDIFTQPVLNYNGGSQSLAGVMLPVRTDSYSLDIPNDDPDQGVIDVTVNYRLYQWDVRSIVDPINSFEVKWTTGVHAQTYALQLDQSDTFAAVPEPTAFTLFGTAALGLLRVRMKRKHVS